MYAKSIFKTIYMTPSKTLLVLSLVGLPMLIGCRQSKKVDEQQNLTQFVDPLIGSGEHGHVFVGANVPFGFVQLGPTQHSQAQTYL